LPRDVTGKFADVPLYVDLRWAKTIDHLSLRNPQFHSAILDLAAPLHGKPKDELDGEDVRQYRRTRRVVNIVIVVLTLLFLTAAGFALWAYIERNAAQSRALAAHARIHLGFNLEQSVEWATVAMKRSFTDEAEAALRESLFVSRIRAKLHLPGQRHNHQTWQVAFNPDDARVVAANMASGEVQILNLETDEEEHKIAVVAGKAFTDGNVVLTVETAGEAIVWDVATGQEVRKLEGRLQELTYAAFSPDGKLLFTSGSGQSGRIWNIDTPGVRTLRDEVEQISQVAFSIDNQFLVTVSIDHTARLWYARTGAVFARSPRTYEFSIWARYRDNDSRIEPRWQLHRDGLWVWRWVLFGEWV
jgi:hypothetical protein